MSTEQITVTKTPQELITEAGLDRDQSYLLQNTGEYIIMFAELDDAPADVEVGPRLILHPGEKIFWQMPATDGFYVWIASTADFQSYLNVNESVT